MLVEWVVSSAFGDIKVANSDGVMHCSM